MDKKEALLIAFLLLSSGFIGAVTTVAVVADYSGLAALCAASGVSCFLLGVAGLAANTK